MVRKWKSRALTGALAATLVTAAVVWAQTADKKKVTTEALGGATRYLTAMSTDKPIYRAGEKVYIRGVILDAVTRVPQKEQSTAFVEIRGPKGDIVASGNANSEDSVWGFSWEVPSGQAGGEYTAKVSYPWQGHAPAERKFDIRAYRPPRIKSQIVFLRDGYAPGDKVTATLHAERAEGGFPEGAKVTTTAMVDGMPVKGTVGAIDAAGNCTVNLDLPAEIPRGEGTLALVIEDGGMVETASKSIPILMQTVDVQVYPEGGDLIAGIPCRVYFEAKQPNGKPADISGQVVQFVADEWSYPKSVVEFSSEHEGRGRFSLTAQKGVSYGLEITEPAGIAKVIPLPAVKEEGATIKTLKDVYSMGDPIEVQVGYKIGGHFIVTLSKREVELARWDSDKVPFIQSEATPWHRVVLDPKDADGVLRVTVWDENETPLAERLVFRQPEKNLRVSVKADQDYFVPGGKVTLTVTTTDAAGKPVAAMVGLTVTDDSVLEMIEKRDQAPRLPVMAMLEPEVKDLADAHVYLDMENLESAQATDLLLGTQGWRRFAFIDVADFIKDNGDAARRVLALRMASRVEEERAAVMDGVVRRGAKGGRWDFLVGMAEAQPGMQLADIKKEDLGRDELGHALEFAEDKDMEVGFRLNRPVMAEEARRKRRMDFVVVREYAHAVRPNRKPNDRADFTETLYWTTGVHTAAQTGQATVSFDLSDSVTTFRVLADAFDADGALGIADAAIESVQPFYCEPKVPLEVTANDVVLLPVNVINATQSGMTAVNLTAQVPGNVQVIGLPGFDLDPLQRERKLIRLVFCQNKGPVDLTLNATADVYSDKVVRPIMVKPGGFPIEIPFGGLLGPNQSATHTVVIPETTVPDSIQVAALVFPTPLANMSEALERLIRDPCGCFEQTSSSNYPLVMAQQYFMTHTGVDPELIQRSQEKLDAGYKRLTGFECKEKGYEWFGGDPGHEALTAYGLLEFSDMSQVREVDKAMIERTRKWLLDRRDGKGGFERNERALDSFGRAPQDTTDAYITWSLLESGETGVEKEIASVKERALASNDSYVIALGANVAALAGDSDTAKQLCGKLVAKQAADGSVEGGATSITNSGGQALTIETTSLTLLAWLRDPAYAGAVEKGMKFLADSCESGRFGSTQSTILALRAIVAYDKSRAKPKAPGTVAISVDGAMVGEPVAFDTNTQGAINLPDITEFLTPGEHTVELKMADGGQMPYAFSVNYNATTPASAPECKLDLKVSLAQAEVNEGEATEANVTVTNKTDDVVTTPVAIVGLPGGLEPRHDQLKELVKKGTIDAYEVIGRDVVLYWRALKPEQKVETSLSLIAAVPGTYTGPASRTYLYYTDEYKQWAAGLEVSIKPR